LVGAFIEIDKVLNQAMERQFAVSTEVRFRKPVLSEKVFKIYYFFYVFNDFGTLLENHDLCYFTN
jgi:hypothetical protein